jgi:hypothetical protein
VRESDVRYENLDRRARGSRDLAEAQRGRFSDDSGVVGATSGLIGEPYEDAAGNRYNPLMIQPAIVLSADRETLKTIYGRAMERRVRFSLYIEDMFATGHDAANRATVKQYGPDAMNVVGLALREEKKLVDKIQGRADARVRSALKSASLSSPRKRESRLFPERCWMPAFAGMTSASERTGR